MPVGLETGHCICLAVNLLNVPIHSTPSKRGYEHCMEESRSPNHYEYKSNAKIQRVKVSIKGI